MSIEFKGKGDSPEVKIARLQKRILKITEQREFFKKELEHYKKVLQLLPNLEYKYNKYSEMMVERKRVFDLEKRVQEQSLLISKMLEETAAKSTHKII